MQDSASAHSDLFTFFDYHRLAATSKQTLSVKGESAGVWLEWLLVLVGVVGEGVVLLRSYGTLRVVTVLLGCCCPSATEMSVVVTAVNWLVKCLLLLLILMMEAPRSTSEVATAEGVPTSLVEVLTPASMSAIVVLVRSLITFLVVGLALVIATSVLVVVAAVEVVAAVIVVSTAVVVIIVVMIVLLIAATLIIVMMIAATMAVMPTVMAVLVVVSVVPVAMVLVAVAVSMMPVAVMVVVVAAAMMVVVGAVHLEPRQLVFLVLKEEGLITLIHCHLRKDIDDLD